MPHAKLRVTDEKEEKGAAKLEEAPRKPGKRRVRSYKLRRELRRTEVERWVVFEARTSQVQAWFWLGEDWAELYIAGAWSMTEVKSLRNRIQEEIGQDKELLWSLYTVLTVEDPA